MRSAAVMRIRCGNVWSDAEMPSTTTGHTMLGVGRPPAGVSKPGQETWGVHLVGYEPSETPVLPF